MLYDPDTHNSTMTCPTTPPTILPPVKRIVVIGDIHGDWDALVQSLTKAGVMDNLQCSSATTPRLSWSGGSTHVVQIGDIVDRGGRGVTIGDEASERRIFDLLDKLSQEAQSSGGGLHILLGNHELMNVMGDLRYNSPLSQSDFGGNIEDRIDAFRPGGHMARRLACSTNVVLKIGDFLFVHGGILPQHCQLSLTKINDIMREYLLGHMERYPPKYFDELYMRQEGLLWSRKLAGHNPSCQLLDKPFQTYRVKHIVIGHTPQDEGINSKCNQKLWRVDVGMSKALGAMNEPQILEILDNGQPTRRNQGRPFRTF